MCMRKPGFEPGLRAWEAPVITATLLPPDKKRGGTQYQPLNFIASATLFTDIV